MLCIEAVEKKSIFIAQAIERCRRFLIAPLDRHRSLSTRHVGLDNVEVLRGRCEEIAHDRRYREVLFSMIAVQVGFVRYRSGLTWPLLAGLETCVSLPNTAFRF